MKKRIPVILIAVLMLSSAVFGVVMNFENPDVTEINTDQIMATPSDSCINILATNWSKHETDTITLANEASGLKVDYLKARAINVIYNNTPIDVTRKVTVYAKLDRIPDTGGNPVYTQGLFIRLKPVGAGYTNMNSDYALDPGLDFRVYQKDASNIAICAYRHLGTNDVEQFISVPGLVTEEIKVTVENGTRNSKNGWIFYLNDTYAGFFEHGKLGDYPVGGGVPSTAAYPNGANLYITPVYGGAVGTMTVNAVQATQFGTLANHTPGGYTYTTPYASCESSGIKYPSCTKCGERLGADEVVPQKTHSEATVQIIDVDNSNVENLPGFINAVNFDNEHCCGRININLTEPATVNLPNLGVIKKMEINGPGVDMLTLTSNITGYVLGVSKSLTINNITFKGNPAVTVAAGQRNGGILFNEGAVGTINNCVFKDLFSEDWAPVFQVHNSTLNLNNCSIINNKTNAVAGAIYTNPTAVLNVNNCLFANNEANIYSIANVNNTTTFKNTTFIGNKCGTNEMINQIAGTRSVKYYNCTILNNTANAGAALAGLDATPGVEIFGSIIAGNNVAGTPSNLYTIPDQAPSAANGWNIVGYTPGYTANDIFGTASPALANIGSVAQGIKIAENSAAANKIPAGAYTGIPSVDSRDVPRPSGGFADPAATAWWTTALNPIDTMIDIGAYEYDNRLDDYNCHGKAIGLYAEHDFDTYVQFAAPRDNFTAARDLSAKLVTFIGSVSQKYFDDNDMGSGFYIMDPAKTISTPSNEQNALILYKEKTLLPTQNQEQAAMYYGKFNTMMINLLAETFTVTKTIIGDVGGSISGNTALNYCDMPEQTFTVTPDEGYIVKSAWVKYVTAGDFNDPDNGIYNAFKHVNTWIELNAGNNYTYTIPANKTCRDFTIEAEFEHVDHVYDVVNTLVPASCTATGYKTFKCVCGILEPGSPQTIIDKLAHTKVVDVEAVAATCLAAGNTEGSHCSTCSTQNIASEPIAQLAHTKVVDVNAVAATCTAEGNTEGSHCATCSTQNVVSEPIAKIAHTGGTAYCNAYAVCTSCGNEYGEFNPANHGANGTHLVGYLAATCTSTGFSGDVYCDGCNVKKLSGTVIAKIAHDWSDWTITVEATYTATGLKTRICNVCGEAETVVIPVKIKGELKLTPSAFQIDTRGRVTIVATVKNVEPGYKILWSSSDPTIATVDENGLVTAVKEGKVTITAQIENSDVFATATITVKENKSFSLIEWLILMITNFIKMIKSLFGIA